MRAAERLLERADAHLSTDRAIAELCRVLGLYTDKGYG